jgi:hypothetical protein
MDYLIYEFLLWPPILWTVRVTTVIVVGALGLATFLYFARFLRPKHFLGVLTSNPPRISEVTGEVAGNKIAVRLDQVQDEQIAALRDRMSALEGTIRELADKGGDDA